MRQLFFNVTIVNDNITEDAEMLIAKLTLDPADQARLENLVTVSPDVATVTIQDDDGKNPIIMYSNFLADLGAVKIQESYDTTINPHPTTQFHLLFGKGACCNLFTAQVG